MFRLMRDKSFDPDLPAIDRVVQLSDETAEDTSHEVAVDINDSACHSDSESCVASECGEAGEEPYREWHESAGLTSLFPDFPGVPEASLMVRKVSNLIHVMNGDGFLLCGRLPSMNFKGYSQMNDRSLAEGCAHSAGGHFQRVECGLELRSEMEKRGQQSARCPITLKPKSHADMIRHVVKLS
eukprot:s804_g4.t1